MQQLLILACPLAVVSKKKRKEKIIYINGICFCFWNTGINFTLSTKSYFSIAQASRTSSFLLQMKDLIDDTG